MHLYDITIRTLKQRCYTMGIHLQTLQGLLSRKEIDYVTRDDAKPNEIRLGTTFNTTIVISPELYESYVRRPLEMRFQDTNYQWYSTIDPSPCG